MDHYSALVVLALLAWVAIHDAIWQKRTDKLLDRLMAGNFKEYNYYKTKYPKDVKEVEEIRKDERIKERAKPPVKADQDAEYLEEAWSEEEQEK